MDALERTQLRLQECEAENRRLHRDIHLEAHAINKRRIMARDEHIKRLTAEIKRLEGKQQVDKKEESDFRRMTVDEARNYRKFLDEFFLIDSPPYIGGTKEEEYKRSVELFDEIYHDPKRGKYFAFAWLFDIGYERKDFLGMMNILKPERKHLKCG